MQRLLSIPIALSLLAPAAALVAQSAPPASSVSAPAPAATGASVAPEVGEMAPDFTAQWADSAGPGGAPITLSALRGKVVVLAFYPADRSSGCTAELTKFRDEYATLFGPDVAVLPISVDSLGSHASWAREMKFPFPLVSDPDQTIARAYGSTIPGRRLDARTVYVIGRDGRIIYRELKFPALSEPAYAKLKEMVAKARG